LFFFEFESIDKSLLILISSNELLNSEIEDSNHSSFKVIFFKEVIYKFFNCFLTNLEYSFI